MTAQVLPGQTSVAVFFSMTGISLPKGPMNVRLTLFGPILPS